MSQNLSKTLEKLEEAYRKYYITINNNWNFTEI